MCLLQLSKEVTMAKVRIVNNTKGPIRINKVGRSPLIISPGEMVVDVSVLGPYNDALLVWQKAGVIQILPVEEEIEKSAEVKVKEVPTKVEAEADEKAEQSVAEEQEVKEEVKPEEDKEEKKEKPKKRVVKRSKRNR